MLVMAWDIIRHVNKTMKIKVKTKFKGMVAFRGKYIDECKKKNEPLQIECAGELMTVRPEELDAKIKSSRLVPDKFSKNMQRLVYYWFVKDGEKVIDNQLKMF